MLSNKEVANNQFTSEVAAECFLIEGLYYLAFDYVPYEHYIFDDEINDSVKLRTSKEQFYKGTWNSDVEIQFEISNMIEKHLGIINPKYSENQEPSGFCPVLMEKQKIAIEEYESELYHSLDPFFHEIYLLIKHKKVIISGIGRLYLKDGEDFDNWDNWVIYEDKGFEDMQRVIINPDYLIFDNILFESNSIKGLDGIFYDQVLIDFKSLYNALPKVLNYKIEGILRQNQFIYEGKTYIEKGDSNKGRKALEWDLFYTELIRYIMIDCKGILPKKQDATIMHMQTWCIKNNFSHGSRGSIQPKISAIYKLFEKVIN